MHPWGPDHEGTRLSATAAFFMSPFPFPSLGKQISKGQTSKTISCAFLSFQVMGNAFGQALVIRWAED